MSHYTCARAKKTGARAGTRMFTDTRPRLFMRPSEIWPAAKIAIDVRKLDGCQAFLPPIRRDRSLALLLRRTATFLGFLETGMGGGGGRTFLEDDFDARLEIGPSTLHLHASCLLVLPNKAARRTKDPSERGRESLPTSPLVQLSTRDVRHFPILDGF